MPWLGGPGIRVSSYTPKGCRFDSWLGYLLPTLEVWSWLGYVQEATNPCFSLASVSLFHFPSLSKSIIKTILGWRLNKIKGTHAWALPQPLKCEFLRGWVPTTCRWSILGKASPEICPFRVLKKWGLFTGMYPDTGMCICSLKSTRTWSFIDSVVMEDIEEMLLSILLMWRNQLIHK